MSDEQILPGLDRRTFLGAGLATGAVALLGGEAKATPRPGGLVLEEATGKPSNGKHQTKKKEISSHSYLFNNIKSTKIQVVF